MATFTRWVWNFPTPTILISGIVVPLKNFIVNIPMGPVANGGVDRHSLVLASITELTAAPGNPVDYPFLGSAEMDVHNIAPRDDGILSLWVHVEWTQVLQLRLNLLVVNGFF